MNNAILNELNKKNPRILRGLHDALGLDFEKPVYAFRIENTFTIPQLWKKSGLKSNEYEAVVLLQSNVHSWSRDELKAVWITGNGTNDFNTDFPRRSYGLSTYFRKSDFNDERKSPTCAYFIAQFKTDLVPKKEKSPVELWKRYKSNPSRQTSWGWSAHRGYYEIDKSGYPVEMKRDDLKARAATLRKERERSRANGTDFTAIMEETRTNLEILRAELTSALTVADSTDKMGAVQTAMTSLYWIFRDFKIAESKTNRKEWSSVAAALEAWNHIETKLNETHSKLKTALAPVESNETEQATA